MIGVPLHRLGGRADNGVGELRATGRQVEHRLNAQAVWGFALYSMHVPLNLAGYLFDVGVEAVYLTCDIVSFLDHPRGAVIAETVSRRDVAGCPVTTSIESKMGFQSCPPKAHGGTPCVVAPPLSRRAAMHASRDGGCHHRQALL